MKIWRVSSYVRRIGAESPKELDGQRHVETAVARPQGPSSRRWSADRSSRAAGERVLKSKMFSDPFPVARTLRSPLISVGFDRKS